MAWEERVALEMGVSGLPTVTAESAAPPGPPTNQNRSPAPENLPGADAAGLETAGITVVLVTLAWVTKRLSYLYRSHG